MRLRPGTVADVAAVHALEALLFGADAWSEASVREELTGPARRVVVACDPEVIGYVVATSQEPADLLRIAVHPAHRRRGLAHRLLAEVAAPRTLLEVSADNEAALAFYAAEGFAEIARRRRYYRDGADAVVMARQQPDAAAGPRLADPDGAPRRVAVGMGQEQAPPQGSATIRPATGRRDESQEGQT